MDGFVGEPNYELIKKAAAKLLREGKKKDEDEKSRAEKAA